MTETLKPNGFWYPELVQRDLIKQAGLDERDFQQVSGFFKYKGRRVVLEHIFDEKLVVSMEGEDDETMKSLIHGFSEIVQYAPFCKYLLNSPFDSQEPVWTYEWNRANPDSRYEELSSNKLVSSLNKIP